MGGIRVLAGLSLAVFLVVILVEAGQVWAPPSPPPMFNPNPPISGEPFTISGITLAGFPIPLYPRSTCTGSFTVLGVSDIFTGAYSFTLTEAAGDFCLDLAGVFYPFTVDPAPSSYTPVTIGGTMLPINRFLIVLPWLNLIVLLGTVATWTLTASRKATKRK